MAANGKLVSRLRNGKKLYLLIASLVILSIITGFSVYETTKATVTISLDGKRTEVKTHAKTVKELLDEENVTVGEHDRLEPGLDAAIEDGMTVTWEQAKQIVLTVDGIRKTKWTTADTVKDVLDANDIEMKPHDEVKPDLHSTVRNFMNIEFQSAFQIPLSVGGEEERVWTTKTTVADVLKQEDVTLDKLDRVEPKAETIVNEDTEIDVIRVEKVTDVIEEAVEYKTVTRKDSSLAKGKEKVLSAGKKGKVKKHYEVTLENGEEVDRKLVKEEKVSDSEDRIVAVGTKELKQTVSRSSGSKSAPSGGKTLYMASTAYTANCSGCSGRTATGINLKSNPNAKVVAVDPNVIPLGTRVHVEGYGYAIAGDTGGAINGNKIDVFFSSKSKANSWGMRKVKVKILD